MSARGFGNQLLVVILAGITLIAGLVMRFVLPEQFLRDDAHLQLAMVPQKAYLTADSFQGVGEIYTALHLEGAAPLAGLLGVGIFVLCVFAAVGWDRLRDAGVLDLAAICASLLISAVYLAQYSKELVTLAIVALVLLLPRRPWADAAIVLACVGYGALLRPYWLIVAGLYLVWRVALSRTVRPALLLLVPVIVYVALQPAFGLALGGGLQSQREAVNTGRPDADSVGSLIQSPLPDTDGPLGILAALLMVLLLILPVPLLLTGSAYHLASALLILAIWVIVLVPVARGRLTTAAGARTPRPVTVASRSAALLLGVLLVQALFEPDYGSYLKHLTPLLPLVLALLPMSLRTASGAASSPAVPVASRDELAPSRPAPAAPAVPTSAGRVAVPTERETSR